MTDSRGSRWDQRKQPRRTHYHSSVWILSIFLAILLVSVPGRQRLGASTADEMPFSPFRSVEGLDQQNQQPALPTGIQEIMFVDSSIGSLEKMLRSLPPSIETFVFDPESDGLTRIIQAVRYRRGVQAIHILSHGGPGMIALGTGTLRANSPDARVREFAAALRAALTEDGDILIYGCNFGAGETGRLAVQALARATGADVAASDDPTGSPILGGDWHLEITEGDVTVQPLAALREGFAGILQSDHSEYTPINIQVYSVYTNTLTFQWEIAHPDRRSRHWGRFRLEYRESGSGTTFKFGGHTRQSGSNTFVENVGYIDGLEPGTSYEVRIRWEHDSGLTHSPWGTLTARTLAPIDVNLQTARTVAGQDGPRNITTATWDRLPIGGRQFLSYRYKDSKEVIPPGRFDTVIYHEEITDRLLAKTGWLKADVEYEVRLVATYNLQPTFEDAQSVAHLYSAHSIGYEDFAFNVTEWVPVGPNAPPEFIEGKYVSTLGRRGKKRYVVAVSEGGAMFCTDEDAESDPILCASATANDPDGDTLTYTVRPEQWDGDIFELDPGTGQLRARARGIAALEAIFHAAEDELAVLADVVDDRGGLDTMILNVELLRPLLIVRDPPAPPETIGQPVVTRASVTISVTGRAEAGATVEVTASKTVNPTYSVSGTATADAGGNYSATLDLSQARDENGGRILREDIAGDWRLTANQSVSGKPAFVSSGAATLTISPDVLVDHPPVARAGPDQTVSAGAMVILDGSGSSDPEGEPHTYVWRQSYGPFVTLINAATAAPSFIAPTVLLEDAELIFSLTVNDGVNESTPDTVTITVQSDIEPCPPDGDVDSNGRVTAADALLAFQQALGQAQLTACQRDIADVFPQPAMPDGSITAADALCIFEKALGLPSCLDSLPSFNRSPVADAGADQSVVVRDMVILSGTASDADGTIAGHVWEQTGGLMITLAGVTSATAMFTAPDVSEEETLTFRLTVTDNEGARGSDEVTVTVKVTEEEPFTSVSAGEYDGFNGCGVRVSGEVVCWGINADGQATPPSGTFTSVSVGREYACGVRDTGEVACWGDDFSGRATPPDGTFVSVSAGSLATCGLRDSGTVECWGENSTFFRGDVLTPPAGTYVSVSLGDYHACGIRDTGEVACWGFNAFGQASPPAGTFVSVSAWGRSTCAIRDTGEVACWGSFSSGRTTPPAGAFVSVGVGGGHACGLRDTGEVACWGYQYIDVGAGEFVAFESPAGIFTSIDSHSGWCGVRETGAVECWGHAQASKNIMPLMGNFVSLSGLERHICGLRDTGEVACWGENINSLQSKVHGQATPPAGTFVSVSAGVKHTCGVRDTGEVACWGGDSHGQSTPPAGTFVSVSAAYSHTCGVRDTGEVACWGRNEFGQSTPPDGNFVSVSAGSDLWFNPHTCGVRDTGEVACWGDDSYGQSTPPVGTFVSVSAGGNHACGIRDTGEVACWGLYSDGRTSSPAGTFVSVSAGTGHTCGVRDTGEVACWGSNSHEEASPPAGIFVSVIAGDGWTCAIRHTGTMACWGIIGYGLNESDFE